MIMSEIYNIFMTADGIICSSSVNEKTFARKGESHEIL